MPYNDLLLYDLVGPKEIEDHNVHSIHQHPTSNYSIAPCSVHRRFIVPTDQEDNNNNKKKKNPQILTDRYIISLHVSYIYHTCLKCSYTRNTCHRSSPGTNSLLPSARISRGLFPTSRTVTNDDDIIIHTHRITTKESYVSLYHIHVFSHAFSNVNMHLKQSSITSTSTT